MIIFHYPSMDHRSEFAALLARVLALEGALAKVQADQRSDRYEAPLSTSPEGATRAAAELPPQSAAQAAAIESPPLQAAAVESPPLRATAVESPPLPRTLSTVETPCALHWEVARFLERNDTEVQAQQVARQVVVEALAHALRATWPYAQLVCYGSTRTGLCTPTSDIDCVVLNPPRVASMQHAVYMLRSIFEQESWVVGTTALANAALPILKLQVAPEARRPDLVFQVDVSVSPGPVHHGLTATHVFTGEIEERPAIRVLTIVLKEYLGKLGLNQTYTGGLCSHAIFLLARAYVVAAGADGRLAQNADLGQLLLGFLDHYGNHFDPTRVTVRWGSDPFAYRPPLAAAKGYPPPPLSCEGLDPASRNVRGSRPTAQAPRPALEERTRVLTLFPRTGGCQGVCHRRVPRRLPPGARHAPVWRPAGRACRQHGHVARRPDGGPGTRRTGQCTGRPGPHGPGPRRPGPQGPGPRRDYPGGCGAWAWQRDRRFYDTGRCAGDGGRRRGRHGPAGSRQLCRSAAAAAAFAAAASAAFAAAGSSTSRRPAARAAQSAARRTSAGAAA